MGKPHLFFAHFLSSLLGPLSSHLRKPHCTMNPRMLWEAEETSLQMSRTESLLFPVKTCPTAFLPCVKGNSILWLVDSNLDCSPPSPSHSQYVTTPPPTLAQPSVYTPNLPRLFQTPWSNKATVISGISIRFLTDLPASVLNYSLFSTHQNLLKDMSGHVMGFRVIQRNSQVT